MLKERTLALIKPIAVREHHTGDIISIIEKNGFDIVAIKKIHLKESEARAFYSIHREKNFFNDLVKFMCSGPIIAIVLEKVNAINEFRKLMGSTDPNEAEEGTIRKLFAGSKQQNAVHGSDSHENSNREVRFFFSELEIVEL
jgi:nucleoside-diphosphate kinase